LEAAKAAAASTNDANGASDDEDVVVDDGCTKIGTNASVFSVAAASCTAMGKEAPSYAAMATLRLKTKPLLELVDQLLSSKLLFDSSSICVTKSAHCYVAMNFSSDSRDKWSCLQTEHKQVSKARDYVPFRPTTKFP